VEFDSTHSSKDCARFELYCPRVLVYVEIDVTEERRGRNDSVEKGEAARNNRMSGEATRARVEVRAEKRSASAPKEEEDRMVRHGKGSTGEVRGMKGIEKGGNEDEDDPFPRESRRMGG
jgi:hypothetical protein